MAEEKIPIPLEEGLSNGGCPFDLVLYLNCQKCLQNSEDRRKECMIKKDAYVNNMIGERK